MSESNISSTQCPYCNRTIQQEGESVTFWPYNTINLINGMRAHTACHSQTKGAPYNRYLSLYRAALRRNTVQSPTVTFTVDSNTKYETDKEIKNGRVSKESKIRSRTRKRSAGRRSKELS